MQYAYTISDAMNAPKGTDLIARVKIAVGASVSKVWDALTYNFKLRQFVRGQHRLRSLTCANALQAQRQ